MKGIGKMGWIDELFNMFSGDKVETDYALADDRFTQIGDSFFENDRVVTEEEVEIYIIEKGSK